MSAPSGSGQRKDDHLRLAHGQQTSAPAPNDFDDVQIVHHALAGIDPERVRPGVDVLGHRWSAPLYINGMTGGTDRTARVNRALAIAARETGIAMASGSVAIALDDPSTAPGFRVIRDENPDGFVMANLGIGRSGEEARRAVDLLEADALQIHLNAVQETVMPEGTCDFSRWPQALEEVVAASPVPVLVKEVGFGLSRRTLRLLHDMGVQIADVSGVGGTDFARIENARRPGEDFSFLSGHGQSAVCCLLDAPQDAPLLLASGGVRSPLDVVRSLALGARAAGVAGAFLKAAYEGDAEHTTQVIRGWLTQLTELMGLFGAETPEALGRTDLLLRGRVREFCELSGIDAAAFARRGDLLPAAGTTAAAAGPSPTPVPPAAPAPHPRTTP